MRLKKLWLLTSGARLSVRSADDAQDRLKATWAVLRWLRTVGGGNPTPDPFYFSQDEVISPDDEQQSEAATDSMPPLRSLAQGRDKVPVLRRVSRLQGCETPWAGRAEQSGSVRED